MLDDQVIDAVWSGKAMTKAGFGNRLTKIRNALDGVVRLRRTSAIRPCASMASPPICR